MSASVPAPPTPTSVSGRGTPIGPVPEDSVHRAGLFALQRLLGDEQLLEFPRRGNGSSVLLRQSLFEKLLSGELNLQSFPSADLIAAQADIRHLSLSQLLHIRIANLDTSTNVPSMHVQGEFLASVEASLETRLVERLASGGALIAAGPSAELVRHLVLIYGAHQHLEAEAPQSDRWLFRSGGVEGVLDLKECKLLPLEDGEGPFTYCHRNLSRASAAVPRAKRQLQWEVELSDNPKEFLAALAARRANREARGRISGDRMTRRQNSINSNEDAPSLGSESPSKDSLALDKESPMRTVPPTLHEENEETLKAQLEEARKTAAEAEAEAQELKDELEHVKQRLAKLEALPNQGAVGWVRKADLEDAKGKAAKADAEAKEEIDQLKASLKEAKAKAAKAEAELEAGAAPQANEEVEALKAELAEAKEKAAKAEAEAGGEQAKKANEEMEALKAELAEAKEKAAKAEAAAGEEQAKKADEEAGAEIRGLKAELEEASAKAGALQKELEEAKGKAAKAEEEASAGAVELKKELEEARAKAAKAEEEAGGGVAELKKELEEARAKAAKAEEEAGAEVAKLKKELEEAREKASKAEEEAAKAAPGAELEEARAKASAADEAAAKAKAEVAELRTKLEATEKAAETKPETKPEAVPDVEALNAELTAAKEAADKAKSEMEELRARAAASEAAAARAGAESEGLRRDLAEARQARRAAEAEVAAAAGERQVSGQDTEAVEFSDAHEEPLPATGAEDESTAASTEGERPTFFGRFFGRRKG